MNAKNRTRARRCEAALRTYGDEFNTRTYLIDFLADARHWCDQHGQRYGEMDRMAYHHYCMEAARRRS